MIQEKEGKERGIMLMVLILKRETEKDKKPDVWGECAEREMKTVLKQN